MKLRIIATVLLICALAGGILGAFVLGKEYDTVLANYEEQNRQLQALEEQAEALRQTLEGLTMDTAQARQDQADALNQEARLLSEQLQTLREEIENLSCYLAENQDAVQAAQEELEYLQGVYDELEKGLAKVEGYIAGN